MVIINAYLTSGNLSGTLAMSGSPLAYMLTFIVTGSSVRVRPHSFFALSDGIHSHFLIFFFGAQAQEEQSGVAWLAIKFSIKLI